ncbi:MAG: DUF5640 domain-containing protein [Chloroflexota bacterium]
MSKKLFYVLSVLALLALVVAACSSAPKLSEQIVGQWQYEDPDMGATMIFDFQPDGKLTISAKDMPEVVLDGTYTWVDGDTIELTITMEGQSESTNADLSIDGDSLTMTMDGETETLTRVK